MEAVIAAAYIAASLVVADSATIGILSSISSMATDIAAADISAALVVADSAAVVTGLLVVSYSTITFFAYFNLIMTMFNSN